MYMHLHASFHPAYSVINPVRSISHCVMEKEAVIGESGTREILVRRSTFSTMTTGTTS